MKIYREILQTLIHSRLQYSPNQFVSFRRYDSLAFDYMKLSFAGYDEYYQYRELYREFEPFLDYSGLIVVNNHIIDINGEVLTWQSFAPYLYSWLNIAPSIYEETPKFNIVDEVVENIVNIVEEVCDADDNDYNVPVWYLIPQNWEERYDAYDLHYYYKACYGEYCQELFVNLYQRGLRPSYSGIKDENYDDISIYDIKDRLINQVPAIPY